MVTSNINSSVLTQLINSDINLNKLPFKNTLLNEINMDLKEKNSDFTYTNIKGMSKEEINELFLTQEDKAMAHNLRLATLFTTDDILGQALFNTVLGEPFEVGYTYLFDRYEDKHSFLSTSDSFVDLLHETILDKKDNGDKKAHEVISQNRLSEVLSVVKSFNFIQSFVQTTKEQRDKENDYSFLYNDYHMIYEELKYKYEDIKNENEQYLQSFLNH